MKKIISLFYRNYDGDHLVRDEIVPGAEWVVAGEGIATRKFDGTCCMVRNGILYKRFELRSGAKIPDGFEPATEVDPVTGKIQGWVPTDESSADKWHREAFDSVNPPPDGTYELCGPKIQGNPERFEQHVLIPHGKQDCPDCPRTFELLKLFFEANDIEGIVWHHPDGRMVKIKAKDFGIKRGFAC